MYPNKEFEPGELMEWHVMSLHIRDMLTTLDEIKETCSELAGIFGAEHSDIKTRLDDLEETLGEHLEVNCTIIDVPLTDALIKNEMKYTFGETPSKEYLEGQADMLDQTGTHPPNCRCAWCEPGDGTAWGS